MQWEGQRLISFLYSIVLITKDYKSVADEIDRLRGIEAECLSGEFRARRTETVDQRDGGVFGTVIHRGHEVWWVADAVVDREGHGLWWEVCGGVQIWDEGGCEETNWGNFFKNWINFWNILYGKNN